MKYRLHLLTIILTLGFFLLPKVNYACTTKTEKSCCKKQEQAKTEKRSCCNHKQTSKKNDCGGKCGHSNCTAPAVSLSIILQNENEFKSNNFIVSIEKQKTYYNQTYLSAGFITIWSPPNIG